MFDTVFDSLLDQAKRSGLPDLSGRIAPVETAPRRLIKRLGTYTNITSAGTLLAQSPRLSTDGLGEIANIKGNALMLAISARKDLTEPLTYILIREGDQQVATSAASNDTARLSPAGVNTLFERAGADKSVSAALSARPDVSANLSRTAAERIIRFWRLRQSISITS